MCWQDPTEGTICVTFAMIVYCAPLDLPVHYTVDRSSVMQSALQFSS